MPQLGKLFPPSLAAFIYIPPRPAFSFIAPCIVRLRHLSTGRHSQQPARSVKDMASQATILEHPSVGQIHGVQPQGQAHVEQYLGIQYATLENAFARGKLVETYKSPVQATKSG